MNKTIYFLILSLISKFIFAACSFSVQSVNLGNYDQVNGSKITDATVGTIICNTATWLLPNPQTATLANLKNNSSLTNGTSTINLDTSSTATTYSGKTYYYRYSGSGSSGTTNADGLAYNFAITGNGTRYMTVTAPSGNILTAGTYTGTIPIIFWVDGIGGTYYNIPVNLTVVPSCTISTSGINFGTVNNSGLTLSTGYVYATCTKNTSLTLSASAGNSGNINSRRLFKNGGAETLVYNVHTDPNLNNVWGDGTSGNIPFTDIGTGSQQTFNIYGAVGLNQYPSPGSYSDNLTITITY